MWCSLRLSCPWLGPGLTSLARQLRHPFPNHHPPDSLSLLPTPKPYSPFCLRGCAAPSSTTFQSISSLSPCTRPTWALPSSLSFSLSALRAAAKSFLGGLDQLGSRFPLPLASLPLAAARVTNLLTSPIMSLDLEKHLTFVSLASSIVRFWRFIFEVFEYMLTVSIFSMVPTTITRSMWPFT